MPMPVAVARWLVAASAAALLMFFAFVAPPTAQAALGDRTLSKGARGADVKELQGLLSKAGFRTKRDGVFGRGTARTVRRLERELGIRVDGVVTRVDIQRIRRALAPSSGSGGFSFGEQKARARTVSGQEAPGEKAVLTEDGLAIPPAGAPEAVKKVIAAGNEIAKTPYRYGGGHGRWKDTAYDCSGSVSYALYGARLVSSPMASGGFMQWAEKGPGRWITIYANSGHMYMVVAGLRFDTSGRRKNGTRWQRDPRPTQSYAIRHPEGL